MPIYLFIVYLKIGAGLLGFPISLFLLEMIASSVAPFSIGAQVTRQ